MTNKLPTRRMTKEKAEKLVDSPNSSVFWCNGVYLSDKYNIEIIGE